MPVSPLTGFAAIIGLCVSAAVLGQTPTPTPTSVPLFLQSVTVQTTSVSGGEATNTIDSCSTAPANDPAFGPTFGGAELTLAGRGFKTGATVTVGGTPAGDVVVEDAFMITAVLPPGTLGLTDVTVTNPDGMTCTLVDSIEYETPVGPIIFSAAVTPSGVSGGTVTAAELGCSTLPAEGGPMFGPISGGSTLTVTGVNFSTNAVVRLGETTVNPSSITPTQIVFTVPPGNAVPPKATITVTNPDMSSCALVEAFEYREYVELGVAITQQQLALVNTLTRITVSFTNLGPQTAVNAPATISFPAGLTEFSWVAAGVNGTSNLPGGSAKDVSLRLTIQPGGVVRIEGVGRTPTLSSSLVTTASVELPPRAFNTTPDAVPNSATATLLVTPPTPTPTATFTPTATPFPDGFVPSPTPTTTPTPTPEIRDPSPIPSFCGFGTSMSLVLAVGLMLVRFGLRQTAGRR